MNEEAVRLRVWVVDRITHPGGLVSVVGVGAEVTVGIVLFLLRVGAVEDVITKETKIMIGNFSARIATRKDI